MSSKQVEPLVKLRDALKMAAESLNEYIDTLTTKAPTKTQTTIVQELTFIALKYETQQGAKLGNYEIATKAANLEDKWTHAYLILRNSNATIQNRYHDDNYEFSYWLFDEGKIYRQKVKAKI